MSILSSKENLNKGQTIIEAVVALAAILIAIVAISVVVTASVSNSSYVKNQNLANKYAQDGIEYIKGVKENNGVVKVNSTDVAYLNLPDGTFCMADDNSLVLQPGAGCAPGSKVPLKREIKIVKNKCGQTYDSAASGEIIGREITVTVSWLGGDCPENKTFCHNTQIISCLKDPATSEKSL